MTDEEILKAIEASAHATSATGVFLNHAFCLLARQSAIDLPLLIDRIRNLHSNGDRTDSTFQRIYDSSKDLLISNLEEMLKQRSRDQAAQ